MTKIFRLKVLTFTLPASIKSKTDENSTLINNAKILQDRRRMLTLYQLQKLFAFLFSSQREAINPNFFKAVLPDYFRESHAQQDTAEFGRAFLDQLEDSLKITENPVCCLDYEIFFRI